MEGVSSFLGNISDVEFPYPIPVAIVSPLVNMALGHPLELGHLPPFLVKFSIGGGKLPSSSGELFVLLFYLALQSGGLPLSHFQFIQVLFLALKVSIDL